MPGDGVALGAMLFGVSHLRRGRHCFTWLTCKEAHGTERQNVLPEIPGQFVAAASVGSFPSLPVPIPAASLSSVAPSRVRGR